MRRLSLALLGLGLGGLLASPAWAIDPPGGTGCRKVAVVTATNEGTTTTEITPNPARICSVSFITSGANGWAEVFQSPDTTDPTHTQAKRIAEPGHATAGVATGEYFGEGGRYTYYGVGARVYRGRLTIAFQD